MLPEDRNKHSGDDNNDDDDNRGGSGGGDSGDKVFLLSLLLTILLVVVWVLALPLSILLLILLISKGECKVDRTSILLLLSLLYLLPKYDDVFWSLTSSFFKGDNILSTIVSAFKGVSNVTDNVRLLVFV